MSYFKYVVVAVFGIGLVPGGAALLAAVIDNGGEGNFGKIFAAAIGTRHRARYRHEHHLGRNLPG